MIPARFTKQRIDEYVRKGYWDSTLVSDFWDRNAVLYPAKEAIVEENTRLTGLQEIGRAVWKKHTLTRTNSFG